VLPVKRRRQLRARREDEPRAVHDREPLAKREKVGKDFGIEDGFGRSQASPPASSGGVPPPGSRDEMSRELAAGTALCIGGRTDSQLSRTMSVG
jgi:hypothetical protein